MACAAQVDLEHPTADEETEIPVRTVPMIPRVFLADDQQEMLRTVAQILEGEFEIVGTADNGQGVLELAPGLSPDVLVLDISMPVLTGIEAALRLQEAGSRAKLIFLTVHEDLDFVEAAISAGAVGYVLKPSLATDLVPAIRRALDGKVFISPSMHLPLYQARDNAF
jgi:DNA-binding NarL/FixJ family response regulator